MKNFLSRIKNLIGILVFVFTLGLFTLPSAEETPSNDVILKELKDNITADYSENYGFDNHGSCHGG